MRGLPGVYTAFFSVLEPHQHIKPHWGYWKGFVRYHLGVVIPDDNAGGKCWIPHQSQRLRTATGARRSNRGATHITGAMAKAVLFDDTFLHDAANESDQVRVVLFLDVARKEMPLAAGAAEPAVFVDRAQDRVGAARYGKRDHQNRFTILVTGPAIFWMRVMASDRDSIAPAI